MITAFRNLWKHKGESKDSPLSPTTSAALASVDEAKQHYHAIDEEHQKRISEWKRSLGEATAIIQERAEPAQAPRNIR